LTKAQQKGLDFKYSIKYHLNKNDLILYLSTMNSQGHMDYTMDTHPWSPCRHVQEMGNEKRPMD